MKNEEMDFDKLQETYEKYVSGGILITKDKGKKELEIECKVPGGPVMQLYMVLEAMEETLDELFSMESDGKRIFDADRAEELLDGVFELLKHDILESLKGVKTDEAD